jgi:translation initiation factor IF-3
VDGRIRAREVLVIGPNSEKLGVMRIEEALARARSYGLNLIEVAATANPPVCKIVDFGKFRYQQAKLDREKRSAHHAGKVKELKFRPNIGEHDYMTKLRNAEAFLDKGMKVKLTLQFRGREMQHPELGFGVLNRVTEDLKQMGHLDAQPKMAGRSIIAMMSPLPVGKRVRKYSEAGHEPEEDIDDDDTDDTKSGPPSATPGKAPFNGLPL